MPKLLLAALLFTLAAQSQAHAALPAKLKAADAELTLNGAGSRSKYLMEMYVAGLYLATPNNDAAEIVAGNNPMAIRLEITSGLVTQEKLVAALNEGFDAATGGDTKPIRGQIEAFRKCFAAPIAKGDVFDIVFLPSRGTIVLKNNKLQGTIPSLAFKQALFAIWLGDAPADEDLKLAMLKK